MHLGQKIKKLRNSKLLTQEKLAELAKVSERTIRRLEAGENTQKETLLLVLKALDISLDEIENKFNDKSMDKEGKNGNLENIRILKRIETGKDLAEIFISAHQFGYSYYDCKTKDQTDKAQELLSTTADLLDIWDMLEIGQRFEMENILTEIINDLEEIGNLWVFGDREICENNWITAVVIICSKDNPLIQEIKLDKYFIGENK